MTYYSLDGIAPVVDPTAYVHPSAVLIGDVIIGPGCYVGPLASLRGDFGRIILEEGANIQDTCVMHGFPDTDTVVGRNGHIGHGAILHGCQVGEDALIGINAVVMDYAEIGAYSIVGASSFVKARFSCPERSLVIGSPATVIRTLKDDETTWKQAGTREYQELTRRCLKSMAVCEPLSELTAERDSMRNTSDVKPKASASQKG